MLFTIPVCASSRHTDDASSTIPTCVERAHMPRKDKTSAMVMLMKYIAFTALTSPMDRQSTQYKALPPSRGRAGSRLYIVKTRLIPAVRRRKLFTLALPSFAHIYARASPANGPASKMITSPTVEYIPALDMHNPEESKFILRIFPPSALIAAACPASWTAAESITAARLDSPPKK